MKKHFSFLLLGIFVVVGLFSQEIKAVHKVELIKSKDYTVKTTISGLKGVDVASVKYLIDSTHIFRQSTTCTIFSDRNDEFLKFYIVEVPVSGEVSLDFGVEVANAGEFAFQAELQYSKNEEKKTIDLPRVYLTSDQEIVVDELIQVPIDSALALKEVSEQKAREDEEALRIAEETKREAIAAQKLIEELALKEVIEQKAIEDAEALRIAKETKTKEIAAKKRAEELALKEAPQLTVKYTIQLLSLSKFSQDRLDNYCKQHQLDINKIKKKKSGEWMKITYGDFDSKNQANIQLNSLIKNKGVEGGFVVSVK